jgi:DNA repair protein RecO (recombination protein O)
LPEASALDAAYALHTRRHGDTSLLIELFTRETGRMACIAKGALRGRAATGVQPFQPLAVNLRGRGEVRTLAQAEPAGASHRLSGRTLYCGLYLNELLMKLTAREDAFPVVFDGYAATLSALAAGGAPDRLLRRFELQLLQSIGLGLDLDEDIHGQPVQPDSRYTYCQGQGLQPVAPGHLDGCSGRTIIALRDGSFSGQGQTREARSLMRQVLDFHLDGRPLRTRDLFR